VSVLKFMNELENLSVSVVGNEIATRNIVMLRGNELRYAKVVTRAE
jgi:hypothetical protein